MGEGRVPRYILHRRLVILYLPLHMRASIQDMVLALIAAYEGDVREVILGPNITCDSIAASRIPI